MAEIEGSRRDQPVVKPREKTKKLVEVTAEFPDKLPKKIAAIIDRFAPFEDLALESDDPAAGLDLGDLMQAEGALNAELVRSIESATKNIRAYLKAQEVQMVKMDVRVEGNMEHQTPNPESVARFTRFSARVAANFSKILQAVAADRRPVASRFVAEIAQYSLLLSMSEHAQQLGIDSAAEEHYKKRDRMHENQSAIFDAVAAASYYEAHGGAPVYPQSAHDAFELLRDGAFVPDTANGISFTLRGITLQGRDVRAVIRTVANQNPLILGVIELSNPVVDETLARFLLSRLTGELVPDGMHVVSAETLFTSRGKGEVYDRIRNAAFGEFLAAVERGDIQEQPFVSFVGDEQKEVKTFRPPTQRNTTPSQTPMPDVATSETPEASVDIAEPQQKTADTPSIAKQLAEINQPSTKKKKEERVVWLESRISWWRVMAAFNRLDIHIDMTGDHPKLRYGKKVSRYLNSHDTDKEHNKRELFRVLREFDIPLNTFAAVLK